MIISILYIMGSIIIIFIMSIVGFKLIQKLSIVYNRNKLNQNLKKYEETKKGYYYAN